MAFVATQNLRSVDRLLSRDNPQATLKLKPFGQDAQVILRYQAAEQNRWYIQNWETFQLVYGFVFFAVMLFGSRESKTILLGSLLLLLIVVVQKFFLTPEVIALGRTTDFLPADVQTPERTRFWVLHNAYTAIEAGKWLLTLLLAGKMIFSRKRSGRSRDSRRQFDRVDKADYRGVNR